MFNNIEELKKLIIQGFSNNDIIKERVQQLENNVIESSEDRSVFNENQVLFYEGFIKKNMVVSPNAGYMQNIAYIADLEELFGQTIDEVKRIALNCKGMSMESIINIVLKYFKYDDQSSYKELRELIKNCFPNDQYGYRFWLPIIISNYADSSKTVSLNEFGTGLIFNEIGLRNADFKRTHQDEISKYVSTYHESNSEVKCNLSVLKNSGAAACTEYSIAVQNILSFLGYKCYMLGGSISSGNINEPHNFNVVESNGRYIIVDAAQKFMGILENVHSVDDLMNLDHALVDDMLHKQRSITYTVSDLVRKSKLR